MSRILVFDLENRIAGEVHARVNRGWVISDGGNATFNLPDKEALKPWMQLGRMIYIDGGGKVPNWAGMIDTPWNAVSPIQVTAYEVPYLLSRSCPFYADVRIGDVREISLRFIELANQVGDTFIREGEIVTGDTDKTIPVNTTSNWEQLNKLVTNAGMEMQIRSEVNNERRLIHYLDIKQQLGLPTQVVLQDGENANMKVNQASLQGEFWNEVLGVNNASTNTGSLTSERVVDQESIDKYRRRTKVLQFNTASLSDLQTFTQNYVNAIGKPTIKLQVSVRDVAGLFAKLRLGNTVNVRATRMILPGSRKGWSGLARITAMSYDEGINQISMNIEGAL